MGAISPDRLDGTGRAIGTRHLERLALPLILLAAGATSLLGLGASSYYVDEVLSVGVADSPLSRLFTNLSHGEISPPGWFAFLHEWGAHVGSTRHEWLMRLPSAICAVGLVAVVYWLVCLLGARRRLALLAAAVCALSPFELQYAQRAQGYAAVGLAVGLAVAAAIAAERSVPRRQHRLLAVSLLSAVAGLLCNYTAVIILAPLCLWLLTRRGVPRAWGWGYTAACTVVGAALVPLLIAQHAAHPERGVGTSATLNGSTLQTMLSLPFAGRVEPLRALAVAVTLVTLAAAVVADRRRAVRGIDAQRLVLLLGIGEPAVLILLTAVGGHFFGLLMLNRYGAVAVPFILAAGALALRAVPRAAAAGLAGVVALLLIAGTVANHRTSSFYLDARGVSTYVRDHAKPTDAVVEPPYSFYQVPLDYYGLRSLRTVSGTAPVLASLLERHTSRIWVLSVLPSGRTIHPATVLALARASLARYAYRPVAARVFPSIAPVSSVLLVSTRGPGGWAPARAASLATRPRKIGLPIK